MNFKNFKKEKSTSKFKGIVSEVFHRSFNNNIHEYVVLPDVARVIAITNDNKFLLLREKSFSYQKSYFSLPGGTVEDTEKPKQAALRELEEETGYTSKNIKLWFDYNFSQTVISKKHYFIAKNCEKKSIPKLDLNENIVVLKLGYNEFLKNVLSDRFKNTEIQNIFFRLKLNKKEEEKFKKLLND
ncbi:NUDIX hydrolase [Candidatus Nomurabacteria bacterium]|nr:NUDIX hydrolase [Candidatus Nomurabacteria bacterium]